MGKITFEFEDKEILQALVKAVGTGGGNSTSDDDDDDDVDFDDLRQELVELYAKLKKDTSASEAKEILHDATGSKLVKSVKDEKLKDAIKAINKELDGDDDGEEVDVASVVTAAKAYFADNSKDELNEIFGDYDVGEVSKKTEIKASLFDDVEPDDLAELMIELTDD